MMNLSKNEGASLRNKSGGLLNRVSSFKEIGVLATLAILCVVIGVVNPVFFTPTNTISVLRQTSTVAIMAIGQAFVIITAGIDLSVGSFLSFGGVSCAAMVLAGVNPWMALVIAMVLCIGLGMITGVVVVKLKINPFIATLAMLNIVSGIAYIITGAMPIRFESAIAVFGSSINGVFPVPIILMILIIIIGFIFLNKTEMGRHIFAVGANEKGAKLSGVKVETVKVSVYAISAALAGFCGIVNAGILNSAVVNAGTGKELDVIAAAVIGGCSLSGGRGSVWGALIGAAVLVVIRNGFVLLKVSSYWQAITIGLIIIAACAIDQIRNSKG